MRFYGFGNYYLSSLQQGLQSAHVIGELFTQNEFGSHKSNQVYEWAKNHKTMVLLNGGNSLALQELFDTFKGYEERGMHIPFAKFHEDEQSLGGALTYVGIIVPAEYYDTAAAIRSMASIEASTYLEEMGLKGWEVEFIFLLNNYRLAS